MRLLLFATLLITATGASAFTAPGEETKPQDLSRDPATTELTLYVDDYRADFYPETEWTRENLLQNALYEALRRHKIFAIKEWVYNRALPKTVTQTLEIQILQWRRSHSGFYEFRASANYYDEEGNKHSLGILTGTKSSIGVFNCYDVTDSFEEVVEDAYRQAFRKIQKLGTENI